MNEFNKNLFVVNWANLDKWTLPKKYFNELLLPEGWSLLPIYKMVKQVTIRERIEDNKQYKMIGVKWYGEGIFEREIVLGQNMSAKWVTPVIPNAFIYNRLFAWKESFAIVPENHSGHYVSNEFPQFIVDETIILPQYLYLIFIQPNIIKIVKGASIGSAAVSRNRLKEEDFLNFQIPVPPIQIQEKIIRFWYNTLEKSKSLIHQSNKIESEIDFYILSEFGLSNEKYMKKKGVIIKQFEKMDRWGVNYNSYNWEIENLLLSNKYPMNFLGLVVEINPDYKFSKEELEKDISFIPMEYVSEVTKRIENMDKRKLKDVIKGYTKFRENDVIFAKITPCMENGKCVVCKNLINGIGIGSTEFHVFKPNMDKILPEYLCLLLRLQQIRNNAKRFFIGTAGQKRVPEEFFIKLKIPVPSLEKQQEIIKKTVLLQETIKEMRKEAEKIIESTKQELGFMLEGKKSIEAI